MIGSFLATFFLAGWGLGLLDSSVRTESDLYTLSALFALFIFCSSVFLPFVVAFLMRKKSASSSVGAIIGFIAFVGYLAFVAMALRAFGGR